MECKQKKILQDAIVQKGLNPAIEVYDKEVGWHKGNINWNQVCNGGISIGALAIAEHIPEIASKILCTAIESIQLPMKAYEPDGEASRGQLIGIMVAVIMCSFWMRWRIV